MEAIKISDRIAVAILVVCYSVVEVLDAGLFETIVWLIGCGAAGWLLSFIFSHD